MGMLPFLLLLLLPPSQGEHCMQQLEELKMQMEDNFVNKKTMKDMIKEEIGAELKMGLEENDQMYEPVMNMMMEKMKIMMEAEKNLLKKQLKKKTRRFMRKITQLYDSNLALNMRITEQKSHVITNQSNDRSAIGPKPIPQVMACAYKDYFTKANSTVTYDRLLSHHTSHGGEGELDITTGVFTCATGGHYTVTVSGTMAVFPGREMLSFLYHNG